MKMKKMLLLLCMLVLPGLSGCLDNDEPGLIQQFALAVRMEGYASDAMISLSRAQASSALFMFTRDTGEAREAGNQLAAMRKLLEQAKFYAYVPYHKDMLSSLLERERSLDHAVRTVMERFVELEQYHYNAGMFIDLVYHELENYGKIQYQKNEGLEAYSRSRSCRERLLEIRQSLAVHVESLHESDLRMAMEALDRLRLFLQQIEAEEADAEEREVLSRINTGMRELGRILEVFMNASGSARMAVNEQDIAFKKAYVEAERFQQEVRQVTSGLYRKLNPSNLGVGAAVR